MEIVSNLHFYCCLFYSPDPTIILLSNRLLTLLTGFSDLGTPPYLLRVMASYLKNRKMVVRHKGTTSNTYDLPGSSAQGTNLGILCFLTSINSCGVPLDKVMECIQHEHKGDICHPILPTPDPHISEKEARFKYIDDMALAQVFPINYLIGILCIQKAYLNM